jgi:MoaA/NifB/PqqE/SkfB family radical SAM enzyme
LITPNSQLAILLTNRCNLSCAYCLRDAKPSDNKEISWPDLRKAINTAYRLGYRKVGISGGESLLYSHFDDLIVLLGKLKMNALIETNGILLTKKRLDFIVKHLNKDAMFGVSLDSDKEGIHDRIRGEGSFKKALDAIRLIKSKGLFLQVAMVVNRLNYSEDKDIIRYIEFCRSLSVNSVHFSRIVGAGRGKSAKEFELGWPKMHEFRALLNKTAYFNRLASGMFTYKYEHSCDRISGSHHCLSPEGVHPCIFNTDITLGPIDQFETILTTGSGMDSLELVRQAGNTDSLSPFLSCVECQANFTGYLKQIKKIKIRGE